MQALSNGAYTLLILTGNELEQLQSSWIQSEGLRWLAGQVDEAQADESYYFKSFYLLALTQTSRKLPDTARSAWHFINLGITFCLDDTESCWKNGKWLLFHDTHLKLPHHAISLPHPFLVKLSSALILGVTVWCYFVFSGGFNTFRYINTHHLSFTASECYCHMRLIHSRILQLKARMDDAQGSMHFPCCVVCETVLIGRIYNPVLNSSGILAPHLRHSWHWDIEKVHLHLSHANTRVSTTCPRQAQGWHKAAQVCWESSSLNGNIRATAFICSTLH